jgi:hypothetical protein
VTLGFVMHSSKVRKSGLVAARMKGATANVIGIAAYFCAFARSFSYCTLSSLKTILNSFTRRIEAI